MIRRLRGWLTHVVKQVGFSRRRPTERSRWKVVAPGGALIVGNLTRADLRDDDRQRRKSRWLDDASAGRQRGYRLPGRGERREDV